MKNFYYLDTCIWLNLFKKEGDESKGMPYWEIAEDFINGVIFSEDKEIIYSGIVLKELKFKLVPQEFKERECFLKQEIKFKQVVLTSEDYAFARKLESEWNYELSFYDCLHIAICKRLNLILVSRDYNLIILANKYIIADKPENLFE